MRNAVSVDKESPKCRFMADKKHPNIRKKRDLSLTMNFEKMEETIKDYKNGKLSQKERTRIFQVGPRKADEAWFNTYIFDVDHPHENSESPKAHILKLRYKNKQEKNKPLNIYYDAPINTITGPGYLYWFEVKDKDDAEYKFPFIVRSFIEVNIMTFGAEYRDANGHAWEPLDMDKLMV